MELSFVTLDVFTDKRFSGNQLAVVQVPKERRDDMTQERKQAVAQEFNLSETVIMHETEDGDKSWDIGIFMVDTELPFAGHPTVGSAWYLSKELKKVDAGTLNTKAGQIPFKVDGSSVLANIPFAYHQHTQGVSPEFIKNAGFNVNVNKECPIVSIVNGLAFALIELDSLEALSQVNATGHEVPVELMDSEWRSRAGFYFFVRTGKADNGAITVRSRMCLGNLEDPCTGSAASALSGYLTLHSQLPSQKYQITQGVEMKRPGTIETEVTTQDSQIQKIQLGGKCVPVMSGKITVD